MKIKCYLHVLCCYPYRKSDKTSHKQGDNVLPYASRKSIPVRRRNRNQVGGQQRYLSLSFAQRTQSAAVYFQE